MLKRPRHNEEGGTILVLTAMLLVVFLGMAALAVDAAMAWSNRRVAQGIADTSVMASLQKIPRTTSMAMSSTDAEQAAESFAATNNTANGSDVTIAHFGVVPSPGAIDVELNVSMISDTPFGRAIGAGDSLTLGASAEGRIRYTVPPENASNGDATMRLFPLGTTTNARLLCLAISGCPGSPSNLWIIAMRRGFSTPTMCQSEDDTNRISITVANLDRGADHLVDFDGRSFPREELAVCLGDNPLGLPNHTVRMIHPGSSGSVIQSIVTEGVVPLLSGQAPLWEYLNGNGGPACDRATIAAQTDPAVQTTMMRACLDSSSGQIFSPSIVGSRQLGWGLRISTPVSSGTTYYESALPIWVHSVFDGTTESTNPPLGSGPYQSAIVFQIDPDMLPSSLVDRVDVGPDSIEYLLVD